MAKKELTSTYLYDNIVRMCSYEKSADDKNYYIDAKRMIKMLREFE